MNDRDADRLELLDRIEKRAPEIKLEKYELSWETTHGVTARAVPQPAVCDERASGTRPSPWVAR